MFDISFEEPVSLKVNFNMNNEKYLMKYLLKNHSISDNSLKGILDISFSIYIDNFIFQEYCESINVITEIKKEIITPEWLANFIIKNNIHIAHMDINQSIINQIKICLKTYLF